MFALSMLLVLSAAADKPAHYTPDLIGEPAAPPTSSTPTATTPSSTNASTPAVVSSMRPKRVAVMKTDTSGDVDAALGPQITSKLAEEIRAQTGAEVISSDEIVALLKHEKERAILGECKEQESCLAELANALGAEIVVSAKLSTSTTKATATNAAPSSSPPTSTPTSSDASTRTSSDGTAHRTYALAVSAVDANNAAVVGRVNEAWGGDALGLLALARPVVTKLFATSTIPKGSLEVVGAVSGSKILVDGEVRGSAELPAIGDLLIGAHHVEIQNADRKPVDRWIVVEADRKASLAVSQEALDEPLLSSWWFWTAAGAGVIAVGAGITGTVLALDNASKTGVAVQLNADKVLGGAR